MPNDKTTSEKKPGFFKRMGARITRWFREMRSELKKVVWPSKKQLINNSLIVFAALISVGAVIALFDFIVNQLLTNLISLLRGAI